MTERIIRAFVRGVGSVVDLSGSSVLADAHPPDTQAHTPMEHDFLAIGNDLHAACDRHAHSVNNG